MEFQICKQCRSRAVGATSDPEPIGRSEGQRLAGPGSDGDASLREPLLDLPTGGNELVALPVEPLDRPLDGRPVERREIFNLATDERPFVEPRPAVRAGAARVVRIHAGADGSPRPNSGHASTRPHELGANVGWCAFPISSDAEFRSFFGVPSLFRSPPLGGGPEETMAELTGGQPDERRNSADERRDISACSIVELRRPEIGQRDAAMASLGDVRS